MGWAQLRGQWGSQGAAQRGGWDDQVWWCEQGSAGDTPASRGVSECAGILPPCLAMPSCLHPSGQHSQLLPTSNLLLVLECGKLWLCPPCLVARPFFCSRRHRILLVLCSRAALGQQGPGTAYAGSSPAAPHHCWHRGVRRAWRRQQAQLNMAAFSGVVLLSCPVLPVLGAWAGRRQGQHRPLGCFPGTGSLYSLPWLLSAQVSTHHCSVCRLLFPAPDASPCRGAVLPVTLFHPIQAGNVS